MNEHCITSSLQWWHLYSHKKPSCAPHIHWHTVCTLTQTNSTTISYTYTRICCILQLTFLSWTRSSAKAGPPFETASAELHPEWPAVVGNKYMCQSMPDTTHWVRLALTSQCSLYAERNEAISFSDTSEGCNNKKTTKALTMSSCFPIRTVCPHVVVVIKVIPVHCRYVRNEIIKANLAPGKESVGRGTRGSLVDGGWGHWQTAGAVGQWAWTGHQSQHCPADQDPCVPRETVCSSQAKHS